MSRRFIDSLTVFVRGGAGGHGLQKFGGIGGKGGDVVLKATNSVGLDKLLSKYPNRALLAKDGAPSVKSCLVGKSGADLLIDVPMGVTVYDDKQIKIGDLNEEGQELLVAAGGEGGSLNSRFPFNGAKGQERNIILDLKLIADVGLVGFPNAGKSTLLKAASRANPKIASYPFTTLQPNLGVLQYPDLRQITMADLPGLIEGAAYNVGMGHHFLKHVERTAVLLMVVDIDGFQYTPNSPHRSCLETIVLLIKELELYDEMLLKKPALLAVNKMDLPDASEKLKEVEHHLKDLRAYWEENMKPMLQPVRTMKFERLVPISARFDRNSVNELKNAVRRVLDEEHEKKTRWLHETKAKKLMDTIDKLNTETSGFYI